MKKITVSFIILVGILFLGVVVMIKPTAFISPSIPNYNGSLDQPLAGRIVPKSIITLGSGLTVTGVVGLSVLGIMMFKEDENDDSRS